MTFSRILHQNKFTNDQFLNLKYVLVTRITQNQAVPDSYFEWSDIFCLIRGVSGRPTLHDRELLTIARIINIYIYKYKLQRPSTMFGVSPRFKEIRSQIL